MNCPLEEFHFTMVSFHFYKDFHFQFLLNHFNKRFIFRKLQFTKKKKKAAINQGLCVNSQKHLFLKTWVENEKYHMISLICGIYKEMIQMNLFIK